MKHGLLRKFKKHTHTYYLTDCQYIWKCTLKIFKIMNLYIKSRYLTPILKFNDLLLL